MLLPVQENTIMLTHVALKQQATNRRPCRYIVRHQLTDKINIESAFLEFA